MGKFAISFPAFGTLTTLKTAGKITSVATRPYECVEFGFFGSGSVVSADTQHEGSACFLDNTSDGTATSQTPERMRQSSNAAYCTAGVNYTVEPTVYASVNPVLFGFNQRGGQRWSVPQGEGLINQFENTNMNLGFRVRSAAAGFVDFMAQWWEQ